MKTFRPTLVASIVCLTLFGQVQAQIPVTDVGALAQLGTTELNNYIRHIEDIAKYVQQIENQYEQLRRLGDPNTYVGMLGLTKLESEIAQVRQGIGRTLADVQQIANGKRGLGYTGNGLYRDISSLPDRFGDKVKWDTTAFKKYDTVSQLGEQFNTDVTNYNRSMNRLGNQYTQLLTKLNSAGSQIEAEKIMGQMNGVTTQMNASGQIVHASADRFAVQSQMNQQMAARDAEAAKQLRRQESNAQINSLVEQLQSKY